MLVDAQDARGQLLRVGLSQKFLAFQHHGENVACLFSVLFFFLYQTAEESLGIVLHHVFRLFLGNRELEDGLPVGEGDLALRVELFPGFLAVVLAQVARGVEIRKNGGVDGFFVLEDAAGSGTLTCAGLNTPGFFHRVSGAEMTSAMDA